MRHYPIGLIRFCFRCRCCCWCYSIQFCFRCRCCCWWLSASSLYSYVAVVDAVQFDFVFDVVAAVDDYLRRLFIPTSNFIVIGLFVPIVWFHCQHQLVTCLIYLLDPIVRFHLSILLSTPIDYLHRLFIPTSNFIVIGLFVPTVWFHCQYHLVISFAVLFDFVMMMVLVQYRYCTLSVRYQCNARYR